MLVLYGGNLRARDVGHRVEATAFSSVDYTARNTSTGLALAMVQYTNLYKRALTTHLLARSTIQLAMGYESVLEILEASRYLIAVTVGEGTDEIGGGVAVVQPTHMAAEEYLSLIDVER